MPETLDKLAKNSGGSEAVPTEASKKINEAKRRLSYICNPLIFESTEYKPERTVNSIEKFIKANPVDRILYSEINSFIVGLNEKERANMIFTHKMPIANSKELTWYWRKCVKRIILIKIYRRCTFGYGVLFFLRFKRKAPHRRLDAFGRM